MEWQSEASQWSLTRFVFESFIASSLTRDNASTRGTFREARATRTIDSSVTSVRAGRQAWTTLGCDSESASTRSCWDGSVPLEHFVQHGGDPVWSVCFAMRGQPG